MTCKDRTLCVVSSFLQKNPGSHEVKDIKNKMKVKCSAIGELAGSNPNIEIVRDSPLYARMCIKWSGYAPYYVSERFRAWVKETNQETTFLRQRTGLSSMVIRVFKTFEPDVLATKTEDEVAESLLNEYASGRDAVSNAHRVAKITIEYAKHIKDDKDKWWYL